MATRKWRSHIRFRSRATWAGRTFLVGAIFADASYLAVGDSRSYLASATMSRSVWPEKDPQETLVAGFLYANELRPGETIASAEVSCTVLTGTDAAPESVLDGDPTISDAAVLQPFYAGVDGVTYTIRCVATLSSGRVLVRAATLPVRST